jgi:hypothetical protein
MQDMREANYVTFHPPHAWTNDYYLFKEMRPERHRVPCGGELERRKRDRGHDLCDAWLSREGRRRGRHPWHQELRDGKGGGRVRGGAVSRARVGAGDS